VIAAFAQTDSGQSCSLDYPLPDRGPQEARGGHRNTTESSATRPDLLQSAPLGPLAPGYCYRIKVAAGGTPIRAFQSLLK
jgi:hypothetical protein